MLSQCPLFPHVLIFLPADVVPSSSSSLTPVPTCFARASTVCCVHCNPSTLPVLHRRPRSDARLPTSHFKHSRPPHLIVDSHNGESSYHVLPITLHANPLHRMFTPRTLNSRIQTHGPGPITSWETAPSASRTASRHVLDQDRPRRHVLIDHRIPG